MIWTWIVSHVSRLLTGLKIIFPTLVSRALATFGLSVVSFNVLLPQFKQFMLQYVTALDPETMNFLGAIGLGQGMSMVFSALVVQLSWRIWIVPKSVADQLPGGGA